MDPARWKQIDDLLSAVLQIKPGSKAGDIFIIAILLLPGTLFAQGIGVTTGTLAGDVRDNTGVPLSNVSVTVTGIEGTKATLTDSQGVYIFPYLTPGQYDIRAELAGFTSVEQTDIQVGLSRRVEISFHLKPSIQENITVTSESPLVDITSTTTGASISDGLTSKIPIGRSLANIIYMAPGVVDAGFRGTANFSISGGSGLDNTYIVDGAVVTHPGFGGLGSVAFNHTTGYIDRLGGSGLPVETIQEVQVITGGFEAQYGEAQGGIINVITKSGGNELHGQAYSYYSPQSSADDLSRVDLGLDAGVSAGGPVLKNKLFFFGAYNLTKSGLTYFLQPEDPAYPQYREVSNKNTTNSYSIKATANLTANNTLVFSATGDPSNRPLSNQDGYGLDTFIDIKNAQTFWHYGTDSQVFRWTSTLSSSMFLEAQAARTHHEYVNDPRSSAKNEPRIQDRRGEDWPDLGGVGGNIDYFGNNYQYSAKLTNLWKTHQFQYGIQLQDISFVTTFIRTGGPFTIFDGQTATQGYLVTIIHNENGETIYSVGARLTSGLIPTTTRYLNWFAQDSWNLTSNLNLNLGIRWERQHIQGDGEGGTGVTFTNNWAPRIGATYDYLKNGKSKLFFHYGRFYEKVPNDLASQFNPSSSSQSYFSNRELTDLIWGNYTHSDSAEVEGHGSSNSSFRTRAQYTNEWIAGMEQEIKPGFSVGAHFIFRNLSRVVENIFTNGDRPITVEEWLAKVNTYQFLTNQDGHIPGFPKLERDYKALEVTVQKQLSNRWQLMGSYRYAQLIGNYDRGDKDHSAAGDFSISPLTQFAGEKGPLPNDIRNMLKVFSSYQWNENLNTGVAFYFQTGRPITPQYVFSDDSIYVFESPAAPRGSLGRTDAITSVDLHADYSIHLLRSQQLTFGLDVFNVFNSHRVLFVDELAATYYPADFVDPNLSYLSPIENQPPRSYRFLLRYSF